MATIEDVATIYKNISIESRVRQLSAVIKSYPYTERNVYDDEASSLWKTFNSLVWYATESDPELHSRITETLLAYAQKDELSIKSSETDALLDLIVNTGAVQTGKYLIEVIEQGTTAILDELVGTISSFSAHEVFDEDIQKKMDEWFFSSSLSPGNFRSIFHGLSHYPSVKASWWTYLAHAVDVEMPKNYTQSDTLLGALFFQMPQRQFDQGIKELPEKYQNFATHAWERMNR